MPWIINGVLILTDFAAITVEEFSVAPVSRQEGCGAVPGLMSLPVMGETPMLRGKGRWSCDFGGMVGFASLYTTLRWRMTFPEVCYRIHDEMH